MAPLKQQLIERKQLLAEFDLLTEADVARVLNIDVKTLKNRPRAQQPAFSKVGRQRLYSRSALAAYLASTTADASPMRAKPKGRRKQRETERRATA